jgi:hypothetical protein
MRAALGLFSALPLAAEGGKIQTPHPREWCRCDRHSWSSIHLQQHFEIVRVGGGLKSGEGIG